MAKKKVFNQLRWDKTTILHRAGRPCQFVVVHSSGMVYAVGTGAKMGGGSRLPEKHAEHFMWVFNELKKSEPDMEVLALGPHKTTREKALSFWPGTEPMRNENQEALVTEYREDIATEAMSGPPSVRQGGRAGWEKDCKFCNKRIKMIRLAVGGHLMPVDATMYLGGPESPPLITSDGVKIDNPTSSQRGYIPHWCNRES